MYRQQQFVRSLKVLLAFAAAGLAAELPQAHASSIAAYTYNIGDVAQNGDGFHALNFNLGYVFQTTESLTITALGVLDVGGNSVGATTGMPVALYYSASTPDTSSIVDGGHTSGTLVAGAAATVTGSDTLLGLDGNAYVSGDGFRYHTLSSPIVLPAGTYELQAANLGQGYQANVSPISLAAGVNSPLHATAVVDGSSLGDASYLSAANLATGNEPGNFGPNFLISVPEPSSLVLLGLAGVGLTIFARRRRPLGSGEPVSG